MVTKELTGHAPGRPCGPNKWASPLGQMAFPRQTAVLGFRADLAASLPRCCSGLFVIDGLPGERQPLSLATEDNSLCPSCLGGWKPALGTSGGPAPPQPHPACPATPLRLTQASLANYAKETGNFCSAAWSGLISTLLGRGLGVARLLSPRTGPAFLKLQLRVTGSGACGAW